MLRLDETVRDSYLQGYGKCIYLRKWQIIMLLEVHFDAKVQAIFCQRTSASISRSACTLW